MPGRGSLRSGMLDLNDDKSSFGKGEGMENSRVFSTEGFLDVTDCTAEPADDLSENAEIGYACRCAVSVFDDGKVEIDSMEAAPKQLERFSMSDIVSLFYTRLYPMDVVLLLEDKELRISFPSAEGKAGFLGALSGLSDSLLK